MIEKKIKNVIGRFDIRGDVEAVKPLMTGHINKTYCVAVRNGKSENTYTLQGINKYVFKNPPVVMENIVNVTEHIKKKLCQNGGDCHRGCLTVIPAKDCGLPYLCDEEGEYWRVYKYIDDAYTAETIENPELLKNAGEGFGDFQCMLSDFPMEKLHETIPKFHDTAHRYDQLMQAYENDDAGRAKYVEEEIEFFRAHHDEMCAHVTLCAEGRLPLRVTHNDTKFNNILLDKKTGKALCAIDLDTVMPGLSVNDFGDAIRYAANNAAEDERDLSKVFIRMDYYNAFAEGFLSKLGDSMTRTEIKNMPLAAKIITLEIAARFLADYLNGDVYFRTRYPEHNLARARCQIQLAKSMEENFEEMQTAIEKYL